MKKLISFFIISIFATLLFSCVDKKDPSDASSNYQVNSWIKDNMDFYYLWNKTIPANLVPSASQDPEEYFYSLTNSNDKWSYITPDALSITAEFEGTPKTIGIEPYFVKIENDILIIVLYVQKNSPAEKSGIKRGDIISKINNKKLTENNYYDEFIQNSYSATLAKLEDETLIETKTVQVTAETLVTDPVAFDTVYNIGEKKIGYLAIISFTSPENFIPKVSSAINRLNSQNIDELIMDLRYNRGGILESAQWLSSACAPSHVSSSNRLINIEYNNILELGMPNSEKYLNFLDGIPNLSLNKVTFLTTGNTASASELVIIGLKPYMQETSIGSNTAGKYVGSFVIYDMNPKPAHNYAIMPITFKYSNAEGLTDFDNGLIPDINIEDDIINLKPFGDINDPIINAAINNITGLTTKSANRKNNIEYSILPNPRQIFGCKLIYDKKRNYEL